MNNGKGYYSVTLSDGTSTQVHTVFAASDYAAARKVRRMTGRMAHSEKDVFYITPAQALWQAAPLQPAGQQGFSFGMPS